MNDIKFSDRLRRVMIYSKEEAGRLGNPTLAPEHLLLGMLRDGENGDSVVVDILTRLDVNVHELKTTIDNQIRSNDNSYVAEIAIQKTTEKILKILNLEMRALGAKEANIEHLMLAILREKSNFATEVLESKNVTYEAFLQAIRETQDIRMSAGFQDDDEYDNNYSQPNDNTKVNTANKQQTDTPVLDNFGTDITKAARENRLDPVVGREKEIERVVQILSRRKKNNPVLIGEPGVGKSAIVEGLAQRIVQKKVSHVLFDKRVISLDMASVVAGTKYRGQFEERMKSILSELKKNPDIILFIDEIHTIVGAGGASGSLDAANMLKPSLARGEIQCIGATTLDEYRKNIEKDGALERRFQKILVEPTSVEDTITILHNIKERYEEHHNVTYTDEAIEACVRLTNRYISDRQFPDKAIDALDEAGSRVHITNMELPQAIENIEKSIEELQKNRFLAVKEQKYELAAGIRDQEYSLKKTLDDEKKKWEDELKNHRQTVNENNIAEVISIMVGVPVQQITATENKRLLEMNNILKTKIIGQDDAVEKITKAIRRNRVGLKNPNKPIGSFMFLGPTGVGKTHLAKLLAEYMFNSKDALIRVDMSEYMEKFSVSRLIGSPPGYVGYEEGGQLTEKVRRKPYSIVLFDEIEKAHADVFNLLLQVLDEGRLTDSLGRYIDFKNTIIIMTSNVGTRQLKEFGHGVGFAPESRNNVAYSESVIKKALNKSFSPEFLNRIDEIITFSQLDENAINQIIDIELKDVYARINELNMNLKLTPEAKHFIASKGTDVQFGARPLKRAIQRYIEDEIAEILLENESLKENATVIIDYNKEDDKIISRLE